MTAPTLSVEFSMPDPYRANRKGPVRWIASHALRYWYLGLLVLAGAFGNAILAAAIPVFVGDAFDAVTASPPEISALGRLAVLIFISQAVRSVLQLARNFGAELVAQHMERNIRDELYSSLLGKSMTFHSLQPIGDTMARATNDVREVNYMFSPGFNLVIGSGAFLIVPLFVAPRYDPSLIITPLIFLIVYILSLWQYLHELRPITGAVRKTFGKMNERLAEAIDGVETVKGAAREEAEIQLFRSNAGAYRTHYVRQGYVEARFLPLLFMVFTQAFGLLQAMLLYRQGVLSVGDVVAYFSLLLLFQFPTFVSLFAYSQVSLGIAGARRILELINRETDLDQNTAGFGKGIQGAITFKDVSFSYDGGEPTLDGISFNVQPGQTVAITGQTGSGKTSVVKLVNRTYDVNAGQVLVDGVDVKDWNLEQLRRHISIIEQDIFLFSRTIAENIAFGRPGASQEEIEEAARAAQAHQFITSFEEGYETVIGERGVTLSGGQRQRIALARAFLTDPRILVLDDSTSAIDSATEDKIQQAIYTASRGRTTLIITHRLSQIRWADQILVLRNGRVAAMGTHDQLMETSLPYRRIFLDQRDGASEGGEKGAE
jgi:ATP-binding cassette subfamily B protein